MPFHMLAKERELCRGVTFIDLDLDEVMESKASTILENHQLSALLNDIIETPLGSSIKLRSEQGSQFCLLVEMSC